MVAEAAWKAVVEAVAVQSETRELHGLMRSQI